MSPKCFLGSRWLSGKESACKCRTIRRCGFVTWARRSSGEGNGNPLQYSFLEYPMDWAAWQAIVHGVIKSCTWLSEHGCTQMSFTMKLFFKKHNLSSHHFLPSFLKKGRCLIHCLGKWLQLLFQLIFIISIFLSFLVILCNMQDLGSSTRKGIQSP